MTPSKVGLPNMRSSLPVPTATFLLLLHFASSSSSTCMPSFSGSTSERFLLFFCPPKPSYRHRKSTVLAMGILAPVPSQPSPSTEPPKKLFRETRPSWLLSELAGGSTRAKEHDLSGSFATVGALFFRLVTASSQSQLTGHALHGCAAAVSSLVSGGFREGFRIIFCEIVLPSIGHQHHGCHRSVKPAPPTETMSKEHAVRFPFIGSAVLLSLFLLFKFLPKDLINTVLTLYFFVLGVLALSATILPLISPFLPASWNDDTKSLKVPYVKNVELDFTTSQLIAAIPGTCFCVWYVVKKHWLANNTLGLAFSIQGIEMLSLGSFKIGGILLAGLFVYDIFWVFFTPVMVSVAKSFDAPIKLVFPTGDPIRPFSMLGLGDIVIPGIFVALALRFDVSRGNRKRYFLSAFGGYTAGLVVTIIVMNWFQAAQPALLYIVPGVVGFVGAHCAINGEIKPLLEFDESRSEEEATGSAEASAGDASAADKKSATDKSD